METREFEIIVIGAGIVGLATALKILEKRSVRLLILEKEERVACHQTGNNSGVIHSGIYYKPGSLKALNCVQGREELYRFCEENGIKTERCGKLIVATSPEEVPALEKLYQRGLENGLHGLQVISGEEIKEYETHLRGEKAIFVPQTGIVDYRRVAEKYAEKIRTFEGQIVFNKKVIRIDSRENGFIIHTEDGDRFSGRKLVNCAGLFSDLICKLQKINPAIQIIPFRGEYYTLRPERAQLIKNLIYPVPDVRFPFLGVHFTRMINGQREAGPNAVLAFKREGYRRTSFSLRDTFRFAGYSGFWLMALKYWKMGVGEFYRSFSKKAFLKALQKMIPEITIDDLLPGGAGVRAQALDKRGRLLDDFCLKIEKNAVNVLNAPSPAATASLAIGEKIARAVFENLY